MNKERFLMELKQNVLTNWAECVNLMDEAAKLKLDEEEEDLRKTLHRYATQHIEQTKLLILAEEHPGSKAYDNEIDSITFEINETAAELQKKKKIIQNSGGRLEKL